MCVCARARAGGVGVDTCSPGADLATVSPVPVVQMWQGWDPSRQICCRGAPSLGADVAKGKPCRRVGEGESSSFADEAGAFSRTIADRTAISATWRVCGGGHQREQDRRRAAKRYDH